MLYEMRTRICKVKKTDGGMYPDKWYESETFYEVHEVLTSGHSKSVFGTFTKKEASEHLSTLCDLMAGDICL